MDKMNMKALGLSLGIFWAAAMLLTAWSAMVGWGEAFVPLIASMYPGFAATLLGGLIGAVWGFIDGFIAGIVIAYLYNKFRKL